MKKIFFDCFTGFIAMGLIPVCFTACKSLAGTDDQLLASAEKLMQDRPDSAYTLLNDLRAENLTKREYAQWCLLYTQSMDKLYMTHTSDTLIRAAVAYFEKRGNALLRTKAYYYTGRVKQDMEDYAQAQEYYLKALKTGQTAGDDRQLALIHSNLGMLYTLQDAYQEALPQMEEAARIFLQLADTVNRAYVLRDIGRTYHVMDSIALALRFYEQVLEDMDGYGRFAVLNEIGNVHIEKKDYRQAELYIREALAIASPEDEQYVYLVLGRLFAETGRSDSARYYLKKCVDESELLTKAGALYLLGDLAWKEEKWKESAQYQREYLALHDSIMKQRDAASIRKIQTLFNFKQIEEERNLALKKKMTAQRVSFVFIMIGLAITLAGFIWWRKIRKQKRDREELLLKYREENERYIEANMELEKHLKQVAILKEKEELTMQMFVISNIYQKLHEKENTMFTAKDQEDLYATINELWPQFIPSLKTLYSRIKDDEILMCCLLKAGIKQVKISAFMHISESAVANKRISLAKKMFGEQAGKNDLSEFICNKKAPVWE